MQSGEENFNVCETSLTCFMLSALHVLFKIIKLISCTGAQYRFCVTQKYKNCDFDKNCVFDKNVHLQKLSLT